MMDRGANGENSIKKFFKEKDAIKHFPAEGDGTLSGVIIDACEKTGGGVKTKRRKGRMLCVYTRSC